MCQVHIYELYNDLETCFVYDVFKDSKDASMTLFICGGLHLIWT
jgi:hypothetical protein